MIVVSDDFKTAMKQPVKEIQAFVDAGDFVIRDEDDLISFKVSCDSGLCKSAMRKLDVKYLGEHNLVGKWVSAGFGVKLPSGAFEYLHYGSFLVSEQTTTKDTGVTDIVAYDKMINAMKAYEPLNVAYPVDVFTYAQALCAACGLELGNSGFPVNGGLAIEKELYENINGITYRDIFVQIAQATATTCVIGNDDKLYFKPLTATGEQLTYDNMLRLKLEPQYGPVNSVILARTPQEDNVYQRDEESVQTHELTEIRIENNEIVDKDRAIALPPIFGALNGVTYYPFETTTEGLGWYEIGDCFDIINDTGDTFPAALFSFNITIDGAVKETLKTTAETKTQTQYQYATTIAKRVKNAELIVNKQEQYIQSLVKDMYDEDGVVNEKYSEIFQDVANIIQTVQNSGGSNLLKNSVMFAYDNKGKPYEWQCGTGGLTIQSDAESFSGGGVSGHSFTLSNNTVSQNVSVKVNTDDSPAQYSFCVRIKKSALGSCLVTIHNELERYEIPLAEGDSSYYGEYKIEGLRPKQNYYTVTFSATGSNGTTFTDCMFSIGEYKSKWAQANGEVMNTQVNVSVDGVLVRSSVYQGDYTVMSPLEFAGYSIIGGTLTRVFSLNKDVTNVRKLEAVDEIKMGGIKIVPINSGDLQGWAFVPTTNDGGGGGGTTTARMVVLVAEDTIELAHPNIEILDDTLIISHPEIGIDSDTIIIK